MVELEPIVVNKKKDLLVKEFNKAEVGEIVKDYLKQHPEVLDEALASRSLDEILASYPDASDVLDFDGSEHSLTQEVKDFIKKCVSVGKLYYNGYYMDLGFFTVADGGEIAGACFGCSASTGDTSHSQTGIHIEYYANIDGGTYQIYYTEF